MSRNLTETPSSSSSTRMTRSHNLIKSGKPFEDGADNLSFNDKDEQNRKPLCHINKTTLDVFLDNHDFLEYGYFTESVDNENNTACHLLFQKMEENFDLDKDPQRIKELLNKLKQQKQLYNCINHKNKDGQTILQKVIMAWVGGIIQVSDETIIALVSSDTTEAVGRTNTKLKKDEPLNWAKQFVIDHEARRARNPSERKKKTHDDNKHDDDGDDDNSKDDDKNSKSKCNKKFQEEKRSDKLRRQSNEEQEGKIAQYRDNLLIDALEFIDNIFPGHIISAVTKPYEVNSGNSILHSLLKAETELRWDRIEGNALFNIFTEMAQCTLIIQKNRYDIDQTILLPNSYILCFDQSTNIKLCRALGRNDFTDESLDNIAESLDAALIYTGASSERKQFNETYQWIEFNLKANKEVDTSQKRIIRRALIKSPAAHKRDSNDFIHLFTTVNPKTNQNLIETAINTTFSVATDSEELKPHKVTSSSHLTPSLTDNYQLLSWMLREVHHEREKKVLHQPFTDTLKSLFYQNNSGEYCLDPKMLDLCIQLVDIDPHLFFQMIHFGNEYLIDEPSGFVIALHQHYQRQFNQNNDLLSPHFPMLSI